MTCPRCHSELNGSGATAPPLGNARNVCPECGVRLIRNVSGVMKTSAVMIAARGERGFYRSVQEVPEPLRTQLIETTSGEDSGVIVIADRAGKEQLSKVMSRREQRLRLAEPVLSRPTPAVPDTPGAGLTESDQSDVPPLPPFLRFPWLAWAGFALVLAVSAIVFAAFEHHW